MRRRQNRLLRFSALASITLAAGTISGPAAPSYRPGHGVARAAAVAGAATTAYAVQPVADSYVNSMKPRANYGQATRLKAERSPVLRGYLRFDPRNLVGAVTRATLRLYSTSRSSIGYDIRGVADNTWQESTISYGNAPTVSATAVGSSGPYRVGRWTSVDVTSLVGAGGPVSFALTTSSETILSIASRESGSTSPTLVVETDAVPDTTPPTAPGNLAVTAVTTSSLSISWAASTDNVGVAGYDVYADNGYAGDARTGSTTTTSYTVSSLSCGTSYTISVAAFDGSGNYSSPTSLIAATSPCPDTVAPTTPTTLIATGATPSSISLSWGASFDNVGVSGYDVYKNGNKVASTVGTTYAVGSLSCATTYTLGVAAYDAAGNHSPVTTVKAATTACAGDALPPTAPTNLTVTATGATTLSLSWSPATDNVGVTGYGVYVNGSRVASVAATAYTFGGLTCGTSYALGVDAYDSAGNRSTKSSYSASTSACATTTTPQIKYRFAYSNRLDQALMPLYGYNLIDVATKSEADATPAGTLGQVWLYDYNNTTCSWEKDDTYIRNTVSPMADDPKVAGFYFANESDPIKCPNAIQQHKARSALIKSLAPNKYTILAVDSNWRDRFATQVPMWKGAADYLVYNPYICYVGKPCDFAWLDTVLKAAEANGNPYFIALQAFAEGNEWRWPTPDEERQMLNRLKGPNLSLLHGYMTFSWNWSNDPLLNHPDVLQVIKDFNLSTSSSTPADTSAPTTPGALSVTGATSTSLSVSWGASSDNVGVAGYGVYRNGAVVGSSASTSYSFGGLMCGTSYTLSVDAYDAAGNRSAQASLIAATSACPDNVAPTAPANLAVTAVAATSVSVSWGASLDNVGVAGYDLFRNGTKVGTIAGTNYTFGGLACGTSYTLGVEAYDVAGNRSTRASVVAVTSACAAPSDTQAPTAPTNVAKTGATDTTISISWSPSSDNVGVTGYDVSSNRTKVASTAATSYTFAGLTCGTSYTLGVEAYDAAGNRSTRSTLTASTNSCAPAASDPVITAAGDICSSPTDCAGTAALIDAIAPTRVLTVGDNAYPDGSSSDYANYYEPNWGRFKAKTSPAPGNHDYHTAGGAGYFGYYGSQAPAAYYSLDIGSWHLISLNGEIGISAGSAQETWLKNDLAAHPAKCTLAYWHEPRFSSGAEHGSDSSFDPFWQDLYAAGVDVVLNGHDHQYERFAPQSPSGAADPNGIREFIVGTGGASHYTFSAPIANSEVRDNTSFGVLKLTLHSASYDWQFVPVAGASFKDSGSTSCH